MRRPRSVSPRPATEKDPARLERWLEKAGTSATVTDVLDEPS